MIDALEDADVDVIVSNAGGCGSNLKEYGHLLRDDAAYAERARRFSAKCKDIAEFLDELGPRAVRHPLALPSSGTGSVPAGHRRTSSQAAVRPAAV